MSKPPSPRRTPDEVASYGWLRGSLRVRRHCRLRLLRFRRAIGLGVSGSCCAPLGASCCSPLRWCPPTSTSTSRCSISSMWARRDRRQWPFGVAPTDERIACAEVRLLTLSLKLSTFPRTSAGRYAADDCERLLALIVRILLTTLKRPPRTSPRRLRRPLIHIKPLGLCR